MYFAKDLQHITSVKHGCKSSTSDILCRLITCSIAGLRAEAVSREVLKKVADDKKMTKQEKDER